MNGDTNLTLLVTFNLKNNTYFVLAELGLEETSAHTLREAAIQSFI